jgi:hypothetical protein
MKGCRKGATTMTSFRLSSSWKGLAVAGMLVAALVHESLAFSSTTTSTTISRPSSRPRVSASLLHVTSRKAVFDGPEWTSIQQILKIPKQKQSGSGSSNSLGLMTVVVGTREDTGDRIVGVVSSPLGGDDDVDVEDDRMPTFSLQENKNIHVYQHSAAKVGNNNKIQDQDAINTMIAALTGVHCAAPRVVGVGGATNSELVSGKVVILGGSDYACFAAEGMAALGSQVTLVSTSTNLNVKNPSGKYVLLLQQARMTCRSKETIHGSRVYIHTYILTSQMQVEILPPAVGDDAIGFASFIGDFDTLLDTAEDERPSRLPMTGRSDDDDENDTMLGMGTTLRLLKQQHKCERYVSSMTEAQSIISKEGVFFGPSKVKNHFQEVQSHLDTNPTRFQSIIPPPSFGRTVEMLLEKGILYKKNKDYENINNNNLMIRGWSLKDFMETTTWPSDSSGTRAVRFGLPVLDEVNEFTMIAEPSSIAEIVSRDAEEEAERDTQNPYVQRIVGEQDLYEMIIKEKRDCVLFLSATFCRTCKSLTPRFTSLARASMEKNGCYGLDDKSYHGILFAKADTGGMVGKQLSRVLCIEAVPAFLLFREGRRFGPALSIARIPSKRLSAAIDLLESGSDWDSSVLQQVEEKLQ